MNTKTKKTGAKIMVLLSTLWLFMSPIMSKTEQPKYQVVAKYRAFEIRQYNPMIIATFATDGHRQEVLSQGFKALADYIFGNNQFSTKVAVTAPVMQQQKNHLWSVYFIMPSHYKLGALPRPNNQKVILKRQPMRKFAVIRFSGFISSSNIDRHEKRLKTYLTEHEIKTQSSPIDAFYNPPWTLPFLRRNEIMFEVQ